jgi:hypothetical protein
MAQMDKWTVSYWDGDMYNIYIYNMLHSEYYMCNIGFQ